MVEYLYNAIRATAGTNITISAEITNDAGTILTEGCHVMLFTPEKELMGAFDGEFNEEDNEWTFVIPKEETAGLNGRYWYCICYYNQNLCFKQPIYLV